MTIIDEIAAERRRQVEKEGWTLKHDDQHWDGEMARAAGCYALYAGGMHDLVAGRLDNTSLVPRGWPACWNPWWWKPKNPRRDLIRAAALIVAEIERLDRRSAKNDR